MSLLYNLINMLHYLSYYTNKTTFFMKIYCNTLFYISDTDECSLNTDKCVNNSHCTNTPGSYNCTCNSGFQGNGTKNCTGEVFIYSHTHTCTHTHTHMHTKIHIHRFW